MLPPPGFRDLTLCGTGATSQVYRATEVRSGRVVALKRLHRQLADSPEALARLKRELEALARLRHPAIVPVRDVIRWQGAPTVVMDFIDGSDLKELIKKRGGLPDFEVEVIARALFGALAAAHAAGIVHRDVKPQNVRIAGDGRVFLLDFGSARLDAASQLTKTGTTLGTPDYMPAELFAGTAYDPRVDIYGAGATLFEALTGQLHQLADSLAELAFKRTNEDAPRVRKIAPHAPLHLAQVIDRCLARDPNDRYSTASLAAWALDHPDEEHAFAMRLATRPPCLHCSAPIAPESEACSACGSDHPFAYAPGWSHVVLRGVRDPGRFFVELNARFPEWRTPEHARAVAEACAAVEEQKQRLLSFVDRDEGEKLARELEAAGVQCELVEDEGASRLPVRLFASYAVLSGVLVAGQAMLGVMYKKPPLDWRMWIAPAVILIGGLVLALWSRIIAVVKSGDGLFSSRPPPVAPNAPLYFGTAAFLAFSLGTAAPYVGFVLREEGSVIPELAAWIMQQRGALFAFALAFAAIGAVASAFRLAGAPRTASPEPSSRARIKNAYSSPVELRKKTRRLGLTAAFVVIALVPAELLLLKALRTIEEPTIWLAAIRLRNSFFSRARPVQENTPYAAPSYLEERMSYPSAQVEREPERFVAAPERRPASVPAQIERWAATIQKPAPVMIAEPQRARATWFGWKELLVLGSVFGATAFFGSKRRKIRRHADQLMQQIDRTNLTRARPPLDRQNHGILTHAADRLARTKWSDGFACHAKRRAVELVHCLEQDDAARAQRALHAVARTTQDEKVDRSFLARCILETDPELELRFALLALEGELEARAAESWARSLSAKPPSPKHTQEAS